MGALFIVVTLILGGTLYLACPTLQEYVLRCPPAQWR
jgi:hypothetical protein